MLSTLKDYIVGIGELFTSLYHFVLDFFSDVVYVIKLTAQFVVKIPTYFSWLPAPVLALVVSIFAVVVIYKVLGREG